MITDMDRLLQRADAAHKTLDAVAPKLERLKAFEQAAHEFLGHKFMQSTLTCHCNTCNFLREATTKLRALVEGGKA